MLVNGSLSSQSGGEGGIRCGMEDDDQAEGMIAMPTPLFYIARIPLSLWFISRNKKQKDKTLFIDARKMETMINRRLCESPYKNEDGSDGDRLKVVSASVFQAFDEVTLQEMEGFRAAAEGIAKRDYMLTTGRYAGIEKREGDGEPFEEKMARLTGEFSVILKSYHELEGKPGRDWGSCGFEI